LSAQSFPFFSEALCFHGRDSAVRCGTGGKGGETFPAVPQHQRNLLWHSRSLQRGSYSGTANQFKPWHSKLLQRGVSATPRAVDKSQSVQALIPSDLVEVQLHYLARFSELAWGGVCRTCLLHQFPRSGRSGSCCETFATPPLPSMSRRSSSNRCSHGSQSA
jgi:hypothetical protein